MRLHTAEVGRMKAYNGVLWQCLHSVYFYCSGQTDSVSSVLFYHGQTDKIRVKTDRQASLFMCACTYECVCVSVIKYANQNKPQCACHSQNRPAGLL